VDPKRSKKRDLATIVIVAGVYYVAGKLGLSLALVHPSASAVWPSTGIALASLLLFGSRLWPAVFLGAFLVNATTAGSVATSLAIATGNTLEATTAAWLVNRYCGGNRVFERAKDSLSFVILACLFSTMISATVGVTSLTLGGFAEWANFWSIWLTWWLGDAVGAAVVAPPILLWASKPRWGWNAYQSVELLALAMGLLITTHFVFAGSIIAHLGYPLSYLNLPFLVWAAFRFGQRESATAVLLMCGVAGWGTLHGLGPFGKGSKLEALVLLQMFDGAFALMVLFFGAAFAEWRQAEQQAQVMAARRRAEEKFRGLLESAPDAMIIVNRDGRIVLVNAQAERIFGYQRAELLDQRVEVLMPEAGRSVHVAHRGNYYANPSTRPMGAGLELRGRRKDGSQFPVDISLSPLETEDGLLVTAAIRDISEQKQVQALLRDLSGRMIILQEEERRRIARELHDSTSQVLAALMIDLNQLQASPAVQAESLRPIVDEAVRLAEQSEREIRTLSYLLHPPLLEELGLASALAEFGRGFSRRSGIRAEVVIDENGLDDLPYEARLALFRIAQEGLTNVHRHSRSATAQVRLHSDAIAVRLEVRDEGQGIPEDALRKIQRGVGAFGVGLLGMRDRLRQLGGRLEIESSGAGTTLRATIPVSRASS